MSLAIREAVVTDIPAITELCHELGYEATDDEIGARLHRITEADDQVIYVAAENASDASAPLGWIHVFETFRVESAPFAEIGGLGSVKPTGAKALAAPSSSRLHAGPVSEA